MPFHKKLLLFIFCIFSSAVSAQVQTFPKCNTNADIEPCYAEWVAENGSFFMGLIKNGLLDGRGAAVFPDGTKYVGDFRSGRRHGYGVLIMDDVPNASGQISIGTWQNGGRVGNILYSWPNGAYFYGFTQGGAIRSDGTISDFVEWKRAFYDLAKPQRKAIQYFLSKAKLTADRAIYNYPIDGVWGRNTLNALATFAALMKPEQFNLQDYRSAQSVLREILTTGANNSPFGYIIGEPSVTHNASTPACPDDLQATKYKCFGSMRYEDGSVYVGDFINGLPNGPGELTRDEIIFSGMFENGDLVGNGKVIENEKVIWEGDWKEFSASLEDEANTANKSNEFPPSTGSGFFVTGDGHIVSNNHVIENCSFVTGSVGGKTQKLDILASDPINDLSLLYSSSLKGEAVKFRASPITLGEEVWVAGYPFGDALSSTIKLTKGIVSSLSGIQNDYTKFQIDAAMQPGNSGGPVLSSEGELLGVSVYKLDETFAQDSFGVTPENTNFAINMQIVQMFLLANGIEYEQREPQVSNIGNLAEKVTVFIGCNR
tara:strand:+ start:2456 stop:4084 length:1629 start_codon:yes stop_codon:yes gene_type:complete